MTFMSIAGRFGLGMVVDRFDPRLVTAISLVSQAVALLVIRQTDTVPKFGRFRRLRFFSRQPHHPAAAESSSRIQQHHFVIVMGLSTAISGASGARLGLIGIIGADADAALLVCIVLDTDRQCVVRPGFSSQ